MNKNLISCDRCGGNNHIAEECLSRLDVNNHLINEDIYMRFAEPNNTILTKIIQTVKSIGSNIKKFLEPPPSFKN